jgi:ribosome biogenesis protein ERB1
MKIARAIRAGIIVPGRKQAKKTEKPKFYDIWANSGIEKANHIAAPKLRLPEHLESYNPPREYLLDKEEEKAWKALDPEDRPHNFLPKLHESLRKVSAYPR